MPNVVLITGVSRFLGGRLAAQLTADPAIERIIGVDTTPPRAADLPRLGRTEFVRADIRNPLIAKVMAQAGVSTVVHSGLMSSARTIGGRAAMQEMNVIGTMQLLAACQKSDTVSRFVLRSTDAVYGCGPADPAVFVEGMHPGGGARTGYAKDAVEVEAYLRGFARRRPDVDVTVLRLTNVIGPTIDSAFTRYLGTPVVPTVLGFDPRVQLLHETDAVEVLRLATVSRRPGTFNVAGDGIVTLSQLLRLAGRVRVPVPIRAIEVAAGLLRSPGAVEFTAEQYRYLTYGRSIDTSALVDVFGFTPQYSTAAAVDSFGTLARSRPRPVALVLGVGSRLLASRGNARPGATARTAVIGSEGA
ncbi:MAG: NAD-dependent epimerase/dehydratase family protein [Jatrophihabitans sp.]